MSRATFGLTDRNPAVLSALLSFHPARKLGDGLLTVFPSNASLGARLHGMPESTLRRHLVAGIVLRYGRCCCGPVRSLPPRRRYGITARTWPRWPRRA